MRISDWSSDVCSSDLTPFYVLPECSRDEGGRSGRLLERHDVVDHAKDIALLHDEQILAIDLDLGARPFAEQDPITGLHRQFDERAVVVAGARPDGDNLAFLRFFLGGVRDDDAARGLLLGVDRSEEHTSELQSLMRISYAVF